MNRHKSLILLLPLCILLSTQTQAQPETAAGANTETGAPTIAVTKLDITDKTLKLNYEIRNTSKQDVWICDSISQECDFEVYLDEDGQTLVVRKRLGVPSSYYWMVQPKGKYIRLHTGQKRVESLLLPIPVNSVYYFYESRKQLQRFDTNATSLSLEIGYYVGDLHEMFFDMLEDTEKTNIDRIILFEIWFCGTLGFNDSNENLMRRDEEVLIPYTEQKFDGEQVLRTIIDDLSIPYKNTKRWPQYNPPDFTICTRVEIEYEPSMLEYFYPYPSQQRLLSREEMEYLRSEKTIIIEDSKRINDFANEIKQSKQAVGGIVSEKSKANVLCYYGKYEMSFIVYDNSSIETVQKQRIKYRSNLKSLRKFTPQIQPFELRMQCAANLKNLWHRMRLYDRAMKGRVQSYSNIKLKGPNKLDDPKMSILEKMKVESRWAIESDRRRVKELYSNIGIGIVYPVPRGWCDAMELAHVGPSIRSKRHEVESEMKVHVCPGVVEALSTYAMNPNCKPDSLPDMVLLFETKGGWNQHGGLELFTFDNHEPRGGCVLLNDGTVKFIRTTEEFQQLRWN